MERLTLDLHGHDFSSNAGPIGVIFLMLIALSRIRAFGRGNSGSSAVEFALAAPFLFLLVFAIIEFGRAWWAKNSHPVGALCVSYSLGYTPWFVGEMAPIMAAMTLTGRSCRAHS
jgi:hypothetical protein